MKKGSLSMQRLHGLLECYDKKYNKNLLKQYIIDMVKMYRKYSKDILITEHTFIYCPHRDDLSEKYLVSLQGLNVTVKAMDGSTSNTFTIQDVINGDKTL